MDKVDQGWLDPLGAGYVLGSKPESIFQVDLGASYDIRRIHFKESAGFSSFMVLVSTSDDATKWTPQQWVYCKGQCNFW